MSNNKRIDRLEEVLEYNEKFVENKEYVDYITTKHPDKKMIIVSCMDTRLTELLPKAMDIRNGDAKIIKNAGGTVVHPFGSVARSILVAIYEFGAEDVMVVGHYGCGMSNLNTDDVIDKMLDKGISQEVIDTLENSGVDIKKWLHGFESVEDSVKQSVKVLRNHPLMPRNVKIHGLVIDSETGKLNVITKGE